MRLTLIVVLLGLAPVFPVIAADEVRVSVFLTDLAEKNGFTLNGLDIVGNDSFEPAARYKTIELAISRALRHFNHVVTFKEGQPVSVTILGRKGNDVGALPENQPEPPREEN